MYEQVNSWEKVCFKLGHDPKLLPDVSMLPEKQAIFTLNSFKAIMITEAYNKIDEDNGVKDKPYYMPYFYRETSGGFSFLNVLVFTWGDCRSAAAGLCFKTENGARSAGQDHMDVYKALD